MSEEKPMNEKTEIPDGYLENAQGYLVPEEKVQEIDKIRDSLVKELAKAADDLAAARAKFEAEALDKIAAFVSLSAQNVGKQLGGQKGNVQLTSYDGRIRVVRAERELVAMNEAVGVAKAAILDCVKKWSKGANTKLVELVRQAFDAKGESGFSLSRILSLRSLEVDDPDWAAAMKALDGAVQVIGGKTYLRFYRRNDATGKYEPTAANR